MKLLTEAHAVVVDAASTDETRYVINSVYLEETKEGLRSVATDGRMLAMVEDIRETLKAEDFPPLPEIAQAKNSAQNAIVPTQAIKDTVKQLPKMRTIPICRTAAIVMSKEETTLVTNDLTVPVVRKARNIEGHYPNYDQVIPKKSTFTISFSPNLLGKACTIAKKFDLNSMKLEFTSDLNPVKITGERDGKRLTVVVMPLRP